MKLQLRVADIVRGKGALDRLMMKDLPSVTAWKLAKASKVIQEEWISYEEVRIDLIQKLGFQDDEGNWLVSQKEIPKFNEALDPILSQEITLEFPLISIDDLGTETFKAADFADCWFLFQEEYEEVEDVPKSEPDPE